MNRSFHRRNLPHLYFNDGTYFITYRLANSIPAEALLKVRNHQLNNKMNGQRNKSFKKYDSLLDAMNYGEKYLGIPEAAEIVKQTLHYPDGKDYKLICYCIMPNHVHLVFELLKDNKGISKIMQSIKRVSAAGCNNAINRKGKFWQDESYDRWVRDERELYFIIRYVLLNPVNAGLVENWFDWKFSFCNNKYLVI